MRFRNPRGNNTSSYKMGSLRIELTQPLSLLSNYISREVTLTHFIEEMHMGMNDLTELSPKSVGCPAQTTPSLNYEHELKPQSDMCSLLTTSRRLLNYPASAALDPTPGFEATELRHTAYRVLADLSCGFCDTILYLG